MPQLYYSFPRQWRNSVNAVLVSTQQKKCSCFRHTKKSITMISCKPHLINTLVKESQAGVFIAYKRALLYEPTEHLSLDHERVKPLMGAVAALQEAYKKWCKHKHDMWALTGDYKTRRALIKQRLNAYRVIVRTSALTGNECRGIISCSLRLCLHNSTQMCWDVCY